MDYYKVLGLNRTASKGEIKEAFRELAMTFHPDKHSASSKSVRDDSTLRFKQASEAYEVLIDDRKRADYDLRYGCERRGTSGFGYSGSSCGSGYGYGYHTARDSSFKYGYARGGGFVSRFEIFLRFLTTRAFLLNFAFAGALLGGTVFIDASGKALWKMHNTGKSFEEAMDSIEKKKAAKEKT